MRFATLTFDALDPDALAQFWADLLDGRVVPGNDDGEVLVELPRSNVPMLFMRVDDPTEGKLRCHPDLHTPDLEADIAHAQKLGATVLRRLTETSVWAILADPEGNEFCIVQRDGPSWPQLEG